MALGTDDFLIDDGTDLGELLRPVVDGKAKGRGAEPRDYNEFPREMFAPPETIEMIPRSDWSAIIKEREATQSRISDVRNTGNNGKPIPSLDQGPNGYCWGHSTAHAAILVRAINNQPYVPLSAYAVCSIIKRGRNEGGWCGLSWKFLKDVGIPDQRLWPQGSRNLALDTPEMRANAALHKVTEDFVDLTKPEWDKRLNFDQLVSCLLVGIPCAVDFNWWAHSVCAMDVVEVEPGSFGIRILNSWSDSWNGNGTGVLRGDRAIPDGALAIRVLPGTPA